MTTAGLIAKKIGMTRMVTPEGQMTAVTLLQITPQKVTKILTADRDGYTGYQIGYFEKREKRLAKPDISRLRKANVENNFTRFKEFRADALPAGYDLGAPLAVSVFEGIPSVDVTGITKGRGFTGTPVRWNTAVGRMTHGSRHHRRPGSLGMRATPGRVFKNRPNPGHYGDEQVTIQNLKILDIDTTNSVIAVQGAVPGHRDGYLCVYPSLKIKAPKAKK
jgi:large subunit ribosomal protein L3